MNCSECLDDPSLKEAFGCEEPTQVAVWEDEINNEFYNCPLRWLTDDILGWYAEYTYDIEFHTGVLYEQQSNLYIEAWQAYKYYFNKFQVRAMDQRSNRSHDQLSQLAVNYHQRKAEQQR